ncbi:hypothetical protein [Flagellimonas algicola]|uniref:Uncharacterized protein n=1 Tax=Flagellimonas algicola TaxID=2583815 RepID=A0ABY2WG85_9FLAO|nr:hypothetical protein [Allomuricauda algicola]TMU50395.1 hypothetical protein FGG15_19805 [Allomuricauda algicola]
MRKLMKPTLPLIPMGTFFPCVREKQIKTSPEQTGSGWKLVYQNDKNGNGLKGNIDALITGTRNGYDVRMGWDWKGQLGDAVLIFGHVAEPLSMSIIQNENVSAIIDPHPFLKSYVNIDSRDLGEAGHIWQCIMTKGTLIHKFLTAPPTNRSKIGLKTRK